MDEFSTEGGDQTDHLPPNLRPLRMLEIIAEAGMALSPADIARESGLPRATVHRLLVTLEAEGYASRDLDGRSWDVGPRASRLGWGLVSARHAVAERRIILRQLAEDLRESCNIAVPDDDAMRYVERVETDWPLQIHLPVGSRVPLHCTASGKAWLASLEPARFAQLVARLDLAPLTARTLTTPEALEKEIARIRRQGHAEDDEEMIEGMVAMAVPIRAPGGAMLGTVSFHAPRQRLDMAAARARLGRLSQAAQALEASIRGAAGTGSE